MPHGRVLLLLLALAGAGRSADLLPDFRLRGSSFSVVSENDKYFAGTDRHYTNGLKLTWLGETDLDQSADFIRTAARLIPWMDPAHRGWRYKVGFTLGQNIFTPADTDRATLVSDDRPFAAYLYGSLLLQAQHANQLRVVELAVGVVGPSALGELFQNAWHEVIDVAPANGWAHQLHDEPGLRLSWERRYRTWQWAGTAGGLPGADLVLRHRLTVGNVSTHAAAGLVLRLGWRLPADFGPDLIRPGGGNDPNAGAVRRFGAYVYASGETRVIARDLFLDGNTWRASHAVDKRPVVADLSIGLVLHWPRFRLAYTQDYRTKEFYGQPRRDVFGSVGFSFLR